MYIYITYNDKVIVISYNNYARSRTLYNLFMFIVAKGKNTIVHISQWDSINFIGNVILPKAQQEVPNSHFQL